ncbi:MAG: phage shock protein PspA [Gammaproteobacteria bacterium]|jgi:phage shock protein A|nr:phage shock protein PspA [Gammaproteobacteria bacterium]
MGVFSRLSDIINANINAVLEKAEDPEKIIRLMIQEMEDTLVEVRTSAAKCIAERKQRQRALSRLDKEVEDWERKAELALDKNRDDLARAALHEKSISQKRQQAVTEELNLLEEHLAQFNDDITRLQQKLQDAKNRQRSLVMRHKHASTKLKASEQFHSDKLADVLFRFESAERRIEDIDARGEAMEIGRPERQVGTEIEDLERNDEVNAELEALKQRRQKVGKTAGQSS